MPKDLLRFFGVDIYHISKILVSIVLTLIVARLLYWSIGILLHRLLIKKQRTIILEERRAKTLFPLLRSVLFYVISFFALLNILELLGVTTTTIIASAGVLGLAVGFGAQSLVKDIISGFFIIFEDQFAVGEFVKIDKFQGIVQEIGLRVTKLRDWGGEQHVIPNGTISSVTNFNRGKMRALVDLNLPYDENIDLAIQVITTVGKRMAEEFKDKILEGPEVQGIINFGDNSLVLRAVAYTKPMEQWEIERELRHRILKALQEAGIRGPSISKVYFESKPQKEVQDDA